MLLQNVNQLKPEAARTITEVCVRAALRNYRDRGAQNTNNGPMQKSISQADGHLGPGQHITSEQQGINRELT